MRIIAVKNLCVGWPSATIKTRSRVMPAVLDDISAEILDLKKQIGATILAHYYQEGEIQALADVTGDSLKLAREATKVDSPVIVFCGVLFMAETAKMLNPSKKVLLPDLQAGCSLVDACPAGQARSATRRCSARTAASSRR